MSKYIDADLYVEMQIYDDEHEEWSLWNGTIEDLLNQWTEQGCPPTVEVSEDAISREYILGEAFVSDEYNGETKSFDLPVVSVRDIEDAPTVVPKPKEGEWIAKDGVFYCSCCDNDSAGLSEDDVHVYERPLPNYCQDCGERLKGADDESVDSN